MEISTQGPTVNKDALGALAGLYDKVRVSEGTLGSKHIRLYTDDQGYALGEFSTWELIKNIVAQALSFLFDFVAVSGDGGKYKLDGALVEDINKIVALVNEDRKKLESLDEKLVIKASASLNRLSQSTNDTYFASAATALKALAVIKFGSEQEYEIKIRDLEAEDTDARNSRSSSPASSDRSSPLSFILVNGYDETPSPTSGSTDSGFSSLVERESPNTPTEQRPSFLEMLASTPAAFPRKRTPADNMNRNHLTVLGHNGVGRNDDALDYLLTDKDRINRANQNIFSFLNITDREQGEIYAKVSEHRSSTRSKLETAERNLRLINDQATLAEKAKATVRIGALSESKRKLSIEIAALKAELKKTDHEIFGEIEIASLERKRETFDQKIASREMTQDQYGAFCHNLAVLMLLSGQDEENLNDHIKSYHLEALFKTPYRETTSLEHAKIAFATATAFSKDFVDHLNRKMKEILNLSGY